MKDSNILLYVPRINQAGERLQNVLMSVVSTSNITIVRNMDSLMNIIRQPVHGVMAAVIMASDSGELKSLCGLRDLLHRVQVILVLPDQNRDTIAMGHGLRPRLISYMESSFMEIEDVLHAIIGKQVHASDLAMQKQP